MSENQVVKKSRVEEALGIVTEVKAGEGVTALLLTLNIFLLLLAYYLIKPVREALILAMPSGAEYKSYMGGAIAIALLVAVPAYGAFAKKVPRNRLMVSVTLFFASHLVVFYALSFMEGARVWIGLVFYCWVGIFNMMVIAQAWAFAADIYNEEQGTRLFALIGVGASLGSALGSLLGVALSNALGVMSMLVVSAGVLVLITVITQYIHVRESRKTSELPERSKKPPKKRDSSEKKGAFGLVFSHRYLTWLALFSVVFTLVNTNGEYMMGRLVSEFAEGVESSGQLPAGMSRGDYIGAWYSEFFLYVNVLGVLLQFLVVSRLIKHAGLKLAFYVLPFIALIDVSLMAIAPIIGMLRIGKIAENATDYSLNNTIRNMLWLPTTEEMKYQAKQAVDTFFVRMGDVGSALLVMALVGGLELGLRTFALVSGAFVLLWLFIASQVLKERDRLLAQREQKKTDERDERDERDEQGQPA